MEVKNETIEEILQDVKAKYDSAVAGKKKKKKKKKIDLNLILLNRKTKIPDFHQNCQGCHETY
jgi:hypothetical protein